MKKKNPQNEVTFIDGSVCRFPSGASDANVTVSYKGRHYRCRAVQGHQRTIQWIQGERSPLAVRQWVEKSLHDKP